MKYVYVLENTTDKSWYIGFTRDLRQRLRDHLSGKGARTTRLKTGWQLVYYEAYILEEDALGREKFLKSGSGRKFLKNQMRHYLKPNLL
jgi:putative endonuclease